ncbi:hypothetical protein HPG69_002128 [Diceros bicornis minor]|uniref:Ig-like domain-containing protein n=1 Tax=Diceros bicornis minor TaxID=77932 RepID=A0A7J7FCB5_DICBM|nr:hypothetical protein HPG69_002128 [Diceros bicornis minor]
MTSGTKQNGRLNCTMNSKELYTLSGGENVEQHPSTLSVQEGNNCVINCTYSDYFPWYKQEHGKHPQLIIDIHSNMDKKEDQRLTVLLNKMAKYLSLHVTDTQPGDSADYFCAANTHCFLGTCNLYSNLRVGIAQKVTQAQPAMLVHEKEAVTLNCRYDTSDARYSLFWYKQPSHGVMMFLIRQDSYNQQNATEGHYSLNFQKANKSIKLVISASQTEDSAVYFCALRETTVRAMLSASCSGLVILLMLRGTNGDSVTQTAGPVTLPEGASLTLNCTYQSIYSLSLFWYVHSSENQELDSRGFRANLVKSDSSFHLKKPSVQMSDSAVYYCALRDTMRGTAEGAEHKPRGNKEKHHEEAAGHCAGDFVHPGLLCERGAGGTESPNPDSPGGSQFHDAVQFFHLCEQRAVVSPKSWGPPHQPLLHSFRDKAEWKIKSYDSHERTPQLTCSPGTCNLYTNTQLGSAPPPTTITSQDQHTAFAQLNIPNPLW